MTSQNDIIEDGNKNESNFIPPVVPNMSSLFCLSPQHQVKYVYQRPDYETGQRSPIYKRTSSVEEGEVEQQQDDDEVSADKSEQDY